MTEEAIARIDKTIVEVKADIKVIKAAVIGTVENDNKIGLKGQVALVKQSLTRVWWVLLIIVGILGYVLRT